VDVWNLPGDSPAGCRLHVEATNGDRGSIRIGALWDKHPNKQVWYWGAGLWVPVSVSSHEVGDPVILNTQVATVVTDRLFASLPSLFPFPAEQVGSHKLLVGAAVISKELWLGRVYAQNRVITISGDPVKYPGASALSNTALYDVGLLAWPPDAAFADAPISGGVRTVRAVTQPTIMIANVAESAVGYTDFNHIFAIPIDGGSFVTTSALIGSDPRGAIVIGETLVVDTIDKDILSPGYTAKQIIFPGDTVPTAVNTLVAADLSMIGEGFKIPPNSMGAFVFAISLWANSIELFGDFTGTSTASVSVEYNPSFLFV
jgi:hypothetical protein